MEKKTPERQCTGCGKRRPKRELLRVVRTPEKTILLDETGKVNGRGAYLCPEEGCLLKARKKKALPRMLNTEIPAEVYDSLQRKMSELTIHGNG